MKHLLLTPGWLLLAVAAAAQTPVPSTGARPPAGPGLTLTTPAIADGDIIPPKYTQLVPHPVSPELNWTHVPDGTVSFTLIMHDPDVAPKRASADNLHWIVINIPGTARGLPEAFPATAQLPDGTIQPKSLRGATGYVGPGAGAAGPYHHYTWELYALDITLPLTADASREDVLKAMDGHILAKAATFARFHR
jgi:Raf kinase inhibitor-like YbhB/YbcL family protein